MAAVGPKRKAGKAARPAPAKQLLAPYLVSMELTNIRCFGPTQRLEFTDKTGAPARWTLLLGVNGIGKTTALQAFASTSHKIDNRKMPPLIQYFVVLNLLLSKQDSMISWNLSSPHGGGSVKKIPDGFKSADGGQSSSVISWKFNKIPETVGFLLPTFAYGVTRQGGRLGGGHEMDSSVGSLFDAEFQLRDAGEWLLQLDHAANRKSGLQRQMQARRDRVVGVLIDVLPDVEAIRFTDPTAEKPTVGVEFKTPFGWVPVSDLGHGYQTTIAWIVDLVSRLFELQPENADPLSARCIVLIDEIDLHMHPAWQRQIMGHLSKHFPNAQFIATAHSPLIVQAADEHTNIIVLKREGDHVVVENAPEIVRNWRVDQILTSDLFGLETARPPQIEKLLTEREKLLTKRRLSPRDKARVEKLESEIGVLPGAETREDRAA